MVPRIMTWLWSFVRHQNVARSHGASSLGMENEASVSAVPVVSGSRS
jgi:hypothetical protein